MNDGDWVEGEPKWWWKYVFPTRERLWLAVLGARVGPQPDPWLQETGGEVLEGLSMLHAAAKLNLTDRAIAAQLKTEALSKMSKALGSLAGDLKTVAKIA